MDRIVSSVVFFLLRTEQTAVSSAVESTFKSPLQAFTSVQ